MNQTGPPTLPYWIPYVVSIAVIYCISLLIHPSADAPDPIRLEGGPKLGLDLLLEVTKVTTALNTAVLGAAAALTVKGRDWSTAWTRWDGAIVMAVFVSVAVSYYGIFRAHNALIGMLLSGALSLGENQLSWGRSLQYWGTLSGVFFLGVAFVRLLEGRGGKPAEKGS